MSYEIPPGQATNLEPAALEFDIDNPRFLPGEIIQRDNANLEIEIIKNLERNADLSELIQSITSNGYINIEPMIVIYNSNTNKYTVLEGNRRLAAIKVISDSKLAYQCGIELPATINEKTLASLSKILVYPVASRKDANEFIGFKHVNGPQKWDPLAKAIFAQKWYESTKQSLSNISLKLGDNHDTIKRMVQALYVLNQAEDAKIFNRNDAKSFNFSHLYTALTKRGYKDFLGLSEGWLQKDPVPEPIPHDKLDNLTEVFSWLYGSKENDLEPLIKSQNPDLKRLNEVLDKRSAIDNLRANRNLDLAYLQVKPASSQFGERLYKASHAVTQALELATGYDRSDTELLDTAMKTVKDAKGILMLMSNTDTE